MYFLDMSAFDPIFWLHHTQMDRLLAMYQYIVPDTWVAIGTINRGMAQWSEGETKNGATPLKPFTKSTYGDYFNSDDIRETRTLGYYYPETSDRSYGQVAQAVSQLYGGGVRSISKRGDNTDDKTGQYLGHPLKDGDYHTVLSITADKFGIDGSYTVHCWLGDDGSNSTMSNSTAPYSNSTVTAKYPTSTSVPASTYSPVPGNTTREPEADYDPKQDPTQDPNYVGSYGVLGAMKAKPVGGNNSYPVVTRGSLPLTTCLQGKVAAGLLASLKPEDVEPYLQKNLYYKVIGVNGEIDPATLPSFHVAVTCTKVIPASSPYDLPDLSGKYEVLTKATEHLPAGKPFTYTPSPIDAVAPGNYPMGSTAPSYPSGSNNNNGGSPTSGTGYPTSGVFPYPTLPWQETGYCPAPQVIKYVYPDGKAATY